VSPELRARIRTQVRTSRQHQGLAPQVTDPATLDRLATRVLELAAELPEPGGAGLDDPATGRHQGNGRGRKGSASNGVPPRAPSDDTAVMTPSPEMRNGAPDPDAVPVPVSPATGEPRGQHSG
jgi:hypothetical protein